MNIAHEYGPSTVGHGEAQCKWCHGTNRENAIISPNHCEERAQSLRTSNQYLTTAEIEAAMSRYEHVKDGDIYRLLRELVERRRAAETAVAPTSLEYNVGEDGWMACDHCDAEVVEALKCTGCGATSIARPQSKTSAKPVMPAGPWEHRWYGSGNDQGDHIFQNGERIAYLGNHHHYDVTRLVYEHNVAVAAVKTERNEADSPVTSDPTGRWEGL